MVLGETPIQFNKQFRAFWATFWEWFKRKRTVKAEENHPILNLVKLQVLGLGECFKTEYGIYVRQI